MTADPQGAPTFERDPFGRLVVVLPSGERVVGVSPVRAFPLSDPDRFVSLCDEKGREVLLLERLADLPPSSARIVAEELSRREFLPVIRKVLHLGAGPWPIEWHVLTDRGQTRFLLAGEDQVRRLPEGGALITDLAGLRYRFPTPDHHSQRILRRFV